MKKKLLTTVKKKNYSHANFEQKTFKITVDQYFTNTLYNKLLV